MDHIDEYLAMASQDLSYSKAICAALALGKQTLNRYYDKTDQSKVYTGKPPHIRSYFLCFYDHWNSPVLHQHHKLNYFKKARWEDNWIETAQDIVYTEFDQTYAFMDINIADSKTRSNLNVVSIIFYIAAHI